MASAWEFPTSLNVGGIDYEIRTDYRAVLDLFAALSDSECFGDTEEETKIIHTGQVIEIMFPKWMDIPVEKIPEAVEKVYQFINMEMPETKENEKVVDWVQDSIIIIPAVNKVLNYEIRSQEYVHWWTFLGAYMEIGESLFSTVIHIREKLIKGQKLDKWEQKFYKENKSLIDFKEKKAQRSEEEKSAISELFYGHKK